MGALTLVLAPCFGLVGAAFGNATAEGGREKVVEGKPVSRQDEVVFLLHGLKRNSQDMMVLQAAFRRKGFRTVNWSYPSDRFSLEKLGQQFGDVVRRHPCKRAHFVCHSMGGLVLRSYLSQSRPAKSGRVVTIGSPHSGASIAGRFEGWKIFGAMFGPGGKELAPSKLPALAMPADFPNIEFGTIIGAMGNDFGMNPLIKGDNDGLVGVAEAQLEGAKESLTLKHHHFTIHLQDDTVTATLRFIETGAFAPPDKSTGN